MLAYPYNNEGDSEMNDIVIENKQPIILDNIQRLIKGMLERYHKNAGGLKKDFIVEEGKKYFKIIDGYVNQDNGLLESRGVHAFVDKENGDLYKPASWRGPAKGVRANLIRDIEILEQRADWAGGYLYRR